MARTGADVLTMTEPVLATSVLVTAVEYTRNPGRFFRCPPSRYSMLSAFTRKPGSSTVGSDEISRPPRAGCTVNAVSRVLMSGGDHLGNGGRRPHHALAETQTLPRAATGPVNLPLPQLAVAGEREDEPTGRGRDADDRRRLEYRVGHTPGLNANRFGHVGHDLARGRGRGADEPQPAKRHG